MNPQHLSDEAVAAFADGVLRGLARERAMRHVNSCTECREAVRVQREAAWALRSATTPPPPSTLLERLRTVPQTTPIQTLPTALAPDGSTMLAAIAAPVAAFVPSAPQQRTRHTRPFVAAAIALAAAGTLAAGSVAGDTSPDGSGGSGQTAQQVGSVTGNRSAPVPMPVNPAYFLRQERP